MADTLSHGPDREPPRWTSPRALAIAGVVLVAVVLLVRGVAGHPARRPPATAHVPAAAPQRPAPAVPFGVIADRGLDGNEPAAFAGLAAGSGPGPLLLTGSRPGWFSTATGRFQPVAGLPGSRQGYGITRVGGGWAAQRYSPPQANCQECDAPPAVYFVSGPGARATVVGAAYDATPAASSGDLWLTAYLPDADIGAASGTAQEVTVTGRPVGPPVRLPAGYVIDRAVNGGLLLAPYSPGPGPVRDELWDPAGRRTVREFTNVVAASPGEIAWNPCPGSCPLKILRLPGTSVVTVRLAHGTWADAGTFSPAGRLLAVQVSPAVQPGGSATASRLEVINTATGRPVTVPGTKLSSLVGVTFGWQPGTGRLLAALARPSGLVQVASWQPGQIRLRVRSVRLPGGTVPVLGDHS